uniref:Uncharacterized protein n=1 Tax=Triticum urartu TaxID=4572 RepID=A0A8R7R9I4_TRIUA
MAPLPRLLQAAIAVASWARADLTRNSTPMSALWKWSGHAVEGGLLRRLEAPANPSHHWLPERLPPLPLASSTSWPCAATRPPSKFFCRLRLTLWSWIPTEERSLGSLSREASQPHPKVPAPKERSCRSHATAGLMCRNKVDASTCRRLDVLCTHHHPSSDTQYDLMHYWPMIA